jgi:hypothetical protein
MYSLFQIVVIASRMVVYLNNDLSAVLPMSMSI